MMRNNRWMSLFVSVLVLAALLCGALPAAAETEAPGGDLPAGTGVGPEQPEGPDASPPGDGATPAEGDTTTPPGEEGLAAVANALAAPANAPLANGIQATMEITQESAFAYVGGQSGALVRIKASFPIGTALDVDYTRYKLHHSNWAEDVVAESMENTLTESSLTFCVPGTAPAGHCACRAVGACGRNHKQRAPNWQH